jgi:hypothetical protein
VREVPGREVEDLLLRGGKPRLKGRKVRRLLEVRGQPANSFGKTTPFVSSSAWLVAGVPAVVRSDPYRPRPAVRASTAAFVKTSRRSEKSVSYKSG